MHSQASLCDSLHFKWMLYAAAIVFLSFELAGCDTYSMPSLSANAMVEQEPNDIKYFPSDEPVKLGVQRFYEGDFGLAQQYFQNAVERSASDSSAWIGLAASYDRLGRFDLADRAYSAASQLIGTPPALLNNMGYSYMLRGDLNKARVKFKAALKLDPVNSTTLNNLALLDQSSKFVALTSGRSTCELDECTR